ncbi:NADH:flavin oxidoreductase [Marinifilum sp. RC60d5]|uniref:NADH:flavin oxidoreductase n=1 Tax=Marinifilum sp. RC60d5 TaxID=3458414 RepID=UPI004036DFB2
MNTKEAFKPAILGKIEVKNRFVRSATNDPNAENFMPNQAIFDKYEDLCKGEVGVIVMGYLVFSKSDHYAGNSLELGVDTVAEFKKVTDMAHAYGTKMVAQINHTSTQLFFQPEGIVYGPSEYTDPMSGIQATAFSKEQIQDFIKEFGQAAVYAKEAGFDAVQIHGAHGYMLNKFMSPLYNKRTDEYGGDVYGRMKIVLDVLSEIKNICGEDYPVWIKLSSTDFDKDYKGLSEEDFLVIGEQLAENGIDAIEVSGGSMAGVHGSARPKNYAAYHLDATKKLSEKVDTPIILVGGLRDVDEIDKILSETKIEAFSMSRALVRESDLVKRWMSGDRTKAKCVACNSCFNPNGIECFFNLSEEKQQEFKEMMKTMQAKS